MRRLSERCSLMSEVTHLTPSLHTDAAGVIRCLSEIWRPAERAFPGRLSRKLPPFVVRFPCEAFRNPELYIQLTQTASAVPHFGVLLPLFAKIPGCIYTTTSFSVHGRFWLCCSSSSNLLVRTLCRIKLLK